MALRFSLRRIFLDMHIGMGTVFEGLEEVYPPSFEAGEFAVRVGTGAGGVFFAFTGEWR